jgi:H+/Cl- antiporter ClcA
MFLLGVSMNCGFIGGIIFPFLTMGYIAGTIMYMNYPYVPQGLCLGTFMISIACGIVPMPFTFTCLVVFIFYYGLYQTAPIFIASFVSYLIISGSGLMKKMALRGKAQNENEGESQKGNVAQPKPVAANKAEADDFALKQYLGNKKNQHQETTSGHH